MMARIACAIINRFSPVLFADNDHCDKLLEKIESHFVEQNTVQQLIRNFDLERRINWKKSTATDVANFLRLPQDNVQNITLGPYMICMGKRYNVRHLMKSDLFEVLFHKDHDNLIRVKLLSRFRRAMIHTLWEKYGTKANVPYIENIKWYFCLCQQLAITLGPCSHVAAVLLYLFHEIRLPRHPVRENCWQILNAAERLVCGENEIENSDSSRIFDTNSQCT